MKSGAFSEDLKKEKDCHGKGQAALQMGLRSSQRSALLPSASQSLNKTLHQLGDESGFSSDCAPQDKHLLIEFS